MDWVAIFEIALAILLAGAVLIGVKEWLARRASGEA